MKRHMTVVPSFVSRAALLLATLALIGPNSGASFAAEGFYKSSPTTYTVRRNATDLAKPVKDARCGQGPTDERAVDVAVVEFREDGSFEADAQIKAAVGCITQARQRHRGGVVVMVFVHGWRHNSSWEDPHFAEFRAVLLSLALRESERAGAPYGMYRRVIGVYLGWPGGHLDEFRERYEIAQRIGRGSSLRAAIRDIVHATKTGETGELGSPVILAGHSMGAMMFQTAYSSLLSAGEIAPTDSAGPEQRRCSRVHVGDRAVAFPDLVLLLNSATDSQITKTILKQLTDMQLSKRVECGGPPFHGPLFISVSSKSDYATKWAFWAANLGRRITDGNDSDLINFELKRGGGFSCPPIQGVPDFGQAWHCLREPTVRNREFVGINIDMPQAGNPRDQCHVRYRFERSKNESTPFWIFQVPDELMDGHNDIFNGRARLLIMALVQMAGATMSVHRTYVSMFEKEMGTCDLPRK